MNPGAQLGQHLGLRPVGPIGQTGPQDHRQLNGGYGVLSVVPGHPSGQFAQRLPQGARVEKHRIGDVIHTVDRGHPRDYRVVGNRHKQLLGHTFGRPPAKFGKRLAKFRSFRWHQHWKRVVLFSAAGGGIACLEYCDLEIPSSIYDEFVSDVSEPGEQGWGKAVTLLETAAETERLEAVSAEETAEEVEAVVEQPDEQVDVVVDQVQAVK